jgi:hypothetical protein
MHVWPTSAYMVISVPVKRGVSADCHRRSNANFCRRGYWLFLSVSIIRIWLSPSIRLRNIDPTGIESECSAFACRVLDAYDVYLLCVVSVLDNIKPVRFSMLAGKFELGARKAYGSVMQTAGHRLHFDPSRGFSAVAGFR